MPSILPPAERRSVVLVATYAALSLLLLVVGDHLPVAWMRGAGAFVFEPFDRFVLTGDRLFAAWRENGALHEPGNFGEFFIFMGRMSVVTQFVGVVNDGTDGEPAVIRAQGRPAGVLVSALVFGVLAHGGLAVGELVPKELVDVLQAVVVLVADATATGWGRRRS